MTPFPEQHPRIPEATSQLAFALRPTRATVDSTAHDFDRNQIVSTTLWSHNVRSGPTDKTQISTVDLFFENNRLRLERFCFNVGENLSSRGLPAPSHKRCGVCGNLWNDRLTWFFRLFEHAGFIRCATIVCGLLRPNDCRISTSEATDNVPDLALKTLLCHVLVSDCFWLDQTDAPNAPRMRRLSPKVPVNRWSFVATTNHLDLLDSAIRNRPVRFKSQSTSSIRRPTSRSTPCSGSTLGAQVCPLRSSPGVTDVVSPVPHIREVHRTAVTMASKNGLQISRDVCRCRLIIVGSHFVTEWKSVGFAA